jgi:hypothetical protein
MADRAILTENIVKKLLSISFSLLFIFTSVSIAAESGILFHSLDPDGPWIYSINPDGTGLKK